MKIKSFIIILIISTSLIAQRFDFLKDYESGQSIIYQFTRSASPSEFFNDTTSTIDIFTGTYRVYIDSILFDKIDSVKSFQLSIHKVGVLEVRNRVRLISSRNIDTLYESNIMEFVGDDYHSGLNRIKGWLIPDSVYQSPRCLYDSTIFYPYNYYYRFYFFPSLDTFDLRGETLVLTNISTDCLDFGYTRTFRITKNDGLLERSFSLFNFFDWSFTDKFIKEEVSGIKIDENIPQEFTLYQNYPNPFNPSTKIKYALSSRQYATLKAYDVLGNEVATLVNEEKPAGNYEVEFDAAGLPSGVYFYQLKAGSFIETKKMIFLR